MCVEGLPDNCPTLDQTLIANHGNSQSTDFLDFDTVHNTVSNSVISGSCNWANNNLKQSFGDGIGSPEEGIQSASKLDNPGKVKFKVNIGSNDHVGKQTLISTKNSSTYSTGHTVDADFVRDSMERLPQNFLLSNGIDNEVHTCSQTRPYDLASGVPSMSIDANDVELFLPTNDVSPSLL